MEISRSSYREDKKSVNLCPSFYGDQESGFNKHSDQKLSDFFASGDEEIGEASTLPETTRDLSEG